jgi:hypothetical protein
MSDSSVTTSTTVDSNIEPIAVNGGDSAVTFDDLDRIESQSKAAKKAEKNEIKDTVKETVKAMDKKKESAKDSDDESEDDDSGEDDAKKDSAKKADDKKEADKKDTGKKEDKSKLEKPVEKKAIKAKLGEKELELDPETVLTLKGPGGKEEQISLKDFQNHYNGKVHWEKRLGDLSNKERQFHSKFETVTSKIKDIFSEADPEMRLFKMAELAGKDPVEVRRNFLKENMNLLEKYYAMSDDEKTADELAYENKILKRSHESRQKDDAKRQAESALSAKITELGKTHQISQDEFWNRHDQLKSLKAEGKFSEKITPEFITETIQKDRLWNSAAEVLEKSEAIPEDKRSGALLDLVETCFHQGLGPKDVREIAEEMWGQSKRSAVIAEKVKEQEELRTGKKGTKKADYSPDNEVTFFGDL